MDIRQLWMILKAHMTTISVIVLGAVALAIAVTLMMPPVYSATTAVIIEFQNRGPLDKDDYNSSQVALSPGYVSTQFDIAMSHSVALKVVKRLRLDENPTRKDRFMRATGGEGSLQDWIAAELLRDLSIKPVRESRVLQISYAANDPEVAATTADAFAQAYIDTRLELNVEPARRNSIWLEEQLKTLRNLVLDAQARLTSYQQKNHTLVGEDKLDTETQRMADLAAQLSAAQAQIQDARSRQLGVNHPFYQRAVAREQALQEALANQKAKMLKFKRQYDEISVLRREVDSAQRTYDSALGRYNQTSLESHANQASVSILNKAVVPLRPSSPKFSLNVMAGLLIGMVVGVGAAFVRELSNRRIRTEVDLTDGLGLPLFGVLEKAGA